MKYILDTSVLLYNPNFWDVFDAQEIIISTNSILELNELKNKKNTSTSIQIFALTVIEQIIKLANDNNRIGKYIFELNNRVFRIYKRKKENTLEDLLEILNKERHACILTMDITLIENKIIKDKYDINNFNENIYMISHKIKTA